MGGILEKTHFMNRSNITRIVNDVQHHFLSSDHYECHDLRFSSFRNVSASKNLLQLPNFQLSSCLYFHSPEPRPSASEEKQEFFWRKKLEIINKSSTIQCHLWHDFIWEANMSMYSLCLCELFLFCFFDVFSSWYCHTLNCFNRSSLCFDKIGQSRQGTSNFLQ